MTAHKTIEYHAEGFPVVLKNFPVYEDEGEYLPDVPLSTLARAIAYALLVRPCLLRGREVRFLRALSGLTRSETARRLRITRQTLINWEDRRSKEIGAPPLMHLALRVQFFSWLFPEREFPPSARRVEARVESGTIAINFVDFNTWLLPRRSVALRAVYSGKSLRSAA